MSGHALLAVGVVGILARPVASYADGAVPSQSPADRQIGGTIEGAMAGGRSSLQLRDDLVHADYERRALTSTLRVWGPAGLRLEAAATMVLREETLVAGQTPAYDDSPDVDSVSFGGSWHGRPRGAPLALGFDVTVVLGDRTLVQPWLFAGLPIGRLLIFSEARTIRNVGADLSMRADFGIEWRQAPATLIVAMSIAGRPHTLRGGGRLAVDVVDGIAVFAAGDATLHASPAGSGWSMTAGLQLAWKPARRPVPVILPRVTTR